MVTSLNAVPGLAERWRFVLGERLDGLSFGRIAGALGVSAARAAQIEAKALARLGCRATVAGIHKRERCERAEALREKGRLVRLAELQADPESVPARKGRPPSARDRAEERLDALASDLLRDAERGRLTPERERWYASEADRAANSNT